MSKKKRSIKVNLLENVSDIFIKRDDIYSKFEKLYLKDKDNYDNQLRERRLILSVNPAYSENETERRRIILSVIVTESEDKILKILDKYYHDIIQNINNGIKFEDCKLPDKTNKVVEFYVIYKFIEILMNKDNDISEYDERMLMLIDKMNNYTKEEITTKEQKAMFPLCKPADTGIANFFYGSSELYSFIISAFLDNDLPIDIVESTKLTKRDMEDMLYYIEELFFNNRFNDYDKESYLAEARRKANSDNMYDEFIGDFVPFQGLRIKRLGMDNLFDDSVYMLYAVGAIIKVFAKLYHKDKDKYNDLLKKYKSLVAINENRIQDKKDLENLNSLRKEIESLKEKNKELTIEKERLNKRYDILNDENNKLKDNIKSLNKDVEDLREILNIMDPEDETEDKLTSQVDRIVLTEEEEKTALLVGGHARFQQKVLEKYPNLRTVTVDIARVNVQLIKNSKLVLLNVKYMSHKLFESVMNIVKKNNIEFRYV